MDYLTKLLTLLLVAALLSSGCTASSAQPQMSQSCQWMALNASQPVVLTAQGSTPGRVVALNFAADTGNLTAVHASRVDKAGQVTVWDSKTHTIVQQRTIDWIDRQLTALSATNNMLVSVDGRPKIVDQHRNEFDSPNGLTKLIVIWDVSTGEQRKLFPLYYSGYSIRGITVAYSGHQILQVDTLEVSLESTDPRIKQHGESIPTIIPSEDATEPPDTFAVGAFDQNGRLFALGFDSGVVWLRNLTGELSSVAAGALWPHVAQGDPKVLALAFDAQGDRLAILRPNSIELRNLRSWFTFLWPPFEQFWPVQMATDVPPAKAGQVAFSPRGDLLAIGTSQGWQLRRTSDLTVLAQQTNVAITSVAFSVDGCTVAFGTQDGAIEVWSMPTP